MHVLREVFDLGEREHSEALLNRAKAAINQWGAETVISIEELRMPWSGVPVTVVIWRRIPKEEV